MAEDYEVKPGDCVSSIAYSRGFFWETLWNHPSNAELKSARKDPNILNPGDILHIPELTPNEESCANEQVHTFKLKGVPAKLKLKVMRQKAKEAPPPSSSAAAGGGSALGGLGAMVSSVASAVGLPAPGGGGADPNSKGSDPDYKPPKNEEEPFKNAPYLFEVDGVRAEEGQTDGDGGVALTLVPNARAGKLVVNKGQPDEKTITLDLGGMSPIEEISGVRKRLRNLGFLCRGEGPEDTPDLQTALRKFQERNALEITGKIDDATRNKLKELHGS